MLVAFRESVLAFSAGALGGAAGSFYVARHMWQRARLQGDEAEKQISDLRVLHGVTDEPPPQQVALSDCYPPAPNYRTRTHDIGAPPHPVSAQRVEVPSLYDLRLRQDVANAWNDVVMRAYEVASRFA